MDDGLTFPPRATSPGHDIGPHEEHPGFIIPVPAILGSENYSGRGRHYTSVFVNRPHGAPIREPIDEGSESAPSSDFAHDGAKYFSERERLKTFDKWSGLYHVTPTDLARNGFIHIGPQDRVLCVFCLKTIVEWEAGDVVHKEHERIYPSCPFVRGKCLHLNKPISDAENLRQDLHVLRKDVKAKYPAYVQEHIRRETFVNWPLGGSVPSPAALAAAGLFYQPLPGKNDRVKCFMCGKAIHKWQPNDDVWVEHARINPHCRFVLEQKGEEFVHQCVHKAIPETVPMPMNHRGSEESEEIVGAPGVSPLNPGDILNQPAAQAVLQNFGDEFSVDQVRKALEELTLVNGPDEPVTSEQLLNKIWEGEGLAELNLNDSDSMEDELVIPRRRIGGQEDEGFDDMIVAEDDILLDL